MWWNEVKNPTITLARRSRASTPVALLTTTVVARDKDVRDDWKYAAILDANHYLF